MSLGICPVFERNLASARFNVLGELISANIDTLDEIARTAKFIPLTTFADSRSVPENFAGDPDDLAEIMGESTEWFEPTEGRIAILALADHVKTNENAASRLDQSSGVVEELMELVRVLRVAESEGVRFRLEMS